MAWLLFMDESGHDHHAMPYEVRGGYALANTHLWPFVQDVLRLELECFGTRLADYKSEVKGLKQLQWKGEGYDGTKTFRSYGIVCVPDPFAPRK